MDSSKHGNAFLLATFMGENNFNHKIFSALYELKLVGIGAQHDEWLEPLKAPRRVWIEQGSRVAVYLDSED